MLSVTKLHGMPCQCGLLLPFVQAVAVTPCYPLCYWLIVVLLFFPLVYCICITTCCAAPQLCLHYCQSIVAFCWCIFPLICVATITACCTTSTVKFCFSLQLLDCIGHWFVQWLLITLPTVLSMLIPSVATHHLLLPAVVPILMSHILFLKNFSIHLLWPLSLFTGLQAMPPML